MALPAIAPMALVQAGQALVPLVKDIVSGYTNYLGKREEERTRRAAIEGETSCRVTAIETSGKLLQSQIEGDTALDMQRCQDVGSLLHRPEVVGNPQMLTQTLDTILTMQQAQYAQSRDRTDKILGRWG